VTLHHTLGAQETWVARRIPQARTEHWGDLVPVSADESARVARTGAEPVALTQMDLGFELAWQSAEWLPDGAPETARRFREIHEIWETPPRERDPYLALIRRCPETELGRMARELRRFPTPEELP